MLFLAATVSRIPNYSESRMQRLLVVLCLLLLSGCANHRLADVDFEPSQRYYYDNANYLNYRQLGDGDKTLFLFHGYGSSGYNWDDLLPLLDTTGYRVFIFDLKGAGFSSRPLRQDHSVAENARIINRFILDYKIKDYVLMGHSFGGGVALVSTLLSQASEAALPSGLVLVNSLSYDVSPPFFIRLAQVPVVSPLAIDVLSPSLMARVSLMRSFHDNSKIREDQLARYVFFMAQHDYADAVTQTARDLVPDGVELLVDAYASISTPTLVVWGEEDTVIPVELGDRLAAEMQNAQLLKIPGCGHNSQEECPEAFADAVSEFLSR